MVKLQFYPLDVRYNVVDDKPVMYLYGRTTDGTQICVRDEQFEPYFYVVPKATANLGEVKEQLKKLEEEKAGVFYSVTRIETVKKNLKEKEQIALRVFVNLPKGVPVLKELVKEIKDIWPYEYDIRYHRRYLVDKGIIPMTLVDVEAEQVTEKSKVPVFNASSIVSAGIENTFEKSRILAVDIETYNPMGKTILPEEHPILTIAVYGKDFEKIICWKRFKTENKAIEFVNSEVELLERFVQLVDEYKPDILTGYFSDGFDLPYIRTRAKKYKIKIDLGLDHTDLQIHGKTRTTAEIAGIVHVDIFRFIRQVVSRSLDTDSYSLDAVSAELLGDNKHGVDLEQLAYVWDNEPEKLGPYCEYNLHDSRLTYQLTEKILPNIIELVKIIGQPLYDVNRMSFSQLVEWFVIKQAASFNEIILNRPGFKQEKERRLKRMKGAFVYEPTPGLYNDIIVFDYRSLYPTIIASHNISIGTLNCRCCEGKSVAPTDGTQQYWFCTKKKGFVSTIIEDLITRRSRIKELIKKKPDDQMLLARSEALKVLANSFYGYLAFSPARWYCFECGESTTAWGRHYIKKVIAAANEEKFRVLYSDTDSIFLQLEGRKKEDALRFMEKINLELPGLMELEDEGFYPAGLFVSVKKGESGAKKKYALLDDRGNVKIKGFETVRRNISVIAREMQKEVLNIILKEKDQEKAAVYVRDVISDLRQHKIPTEKVVIATQLKKDIADYETVGPHVAAAKKMAANGVPVGPGTMVKFVVTKGSGNIRDRVALPDDVKDNEYDAEYYINHQIIPNVERIFAALNKNIGDEVVPESQKDLGTWFS